MAPIVPIDYTSKDFEGFRQSLLDYASIAYPDWTGRTKADFGVTLVELFSYMGDVLSYYGDRVAQEAFISTASQRASMLAHASVLGYRPYGYISSSGQILLLSAGSTITVPAGTKFSTDYIPAYDDAIIFETPADADVDNDPDGTSVTIVQGETQGTLSKILNAGASSEANIKVLTLGTSDGSMDQTFRLPDTKVIDGTVRIFVDDLASANPSAILEWTEAASLLATGPDDTSFQVTLEENDSVTVTLGDGLNSQIPLSGVRIYTTYRTGAGIKGNLDAGQVVNIVDPIVGLSIVAAGDMTGGANPEDVDSIRINAPKVFGTQDRAVTLNDYENLALTTTQVSKAKAIAGNSTSVTVFVVGPQGATPDPSLISSVQAYMADRVLAGTDVQILPGNAVQINVGTLNLPVKVGVYRHFSTVGVQVAAELAIASVFNTANTVLGQRIPVSSIYAAVSAIPGVAYVVVPVMVRDGDLQTGAADIVCREWEFPVVGSISVTAEAAD